MRGDSSSSGGSDDGDLSSDSSSEEKEEFSDRPGAHNGDDFGAWAEESSGEDSDEPPEIPGSPIAQVDCIDSLHFALVRTLKGSLWCRNCKQEASLQQTLALSPATRISRQTDHI